MVTTSNRDDAVHKKGLSYFSEQAKLNQENLCINPIHFNMVGL